MSQPPELISDYSQTQLGGSWRGPSPVIEMPTKLRTRLKPTARDYGVVSSAQSRRAKMVGGVDANTVESPPSEGAQGPNKVPPRSLPPVPSYQQNIEVTSHQPSAPRPPSVPPRQPSNPPPARQHFGPRCPSGQTQRHPSPTCYDPPSPLPQDDAQPHHWPDDFDNLPQSKEELSPTIRPFDIPTTKIIPPTPQTTVPRIASGAGAPDVAGTLNDLPHDPPNDLSVVSGMSDDVCAVSTGKATPQPSAPSTPSRGRRSADVIKILEDSYEDLDAILEGVASRTSLSTQQVTESWHKSCSRIINGSNYWNIYESYFKAYEEEERKRIGMSLNEPGTPNLVSRCYRRFIEAEGEQWKEVLEVFELTEITKSPDHTASQRSQTFKKIERKIVQILDTAAAKHGFQAAIVMCGNIVDEDTSLAFQHTTRGAIGFWMTRCHAHPTAIVGHLKAHVYDDASLRIVDDAFKDETDYRMVTGHPDRKLETSVNVENTNIPRPSSQMSDYVKNPRVQRPASPPSDYVSMDEGDPSSRIKEGLTKLVERCGVDTSKLKGNNFPWKTLLSFLASKSLILEGYPHGVLMPGQSRHPGTRTKGINDLTLAEKQKLYSAIKTN
ncbi:hypothetical protein J3R83DRAFT_12535 [Lanmaoa asiatica]|nr:hypothetical protein J3R83DRAFT_12535 [Lanmaoa asiatica]